MNKIQTEELNMIDSTILFNEENKAVTELIPALANAYVELNGISNSTHIKVKLQEAATDGYTDNKDDNKENLCVIANEIANVTFTWANDMGNKVVMAKVKTSISDLRDLGKGKLADTCELYYDIALANQKALVDYGISELDLNTFSNTIKSYRLSVPANRLAVSDRKAYRAEIEALLKKGKAILRNKIDRLTLRFKKTNPLYYNKYKSIRMVINKGSRSTAFRLLVKDAKTGDPIVGARVAIAALDFETVSDKRGLVSAKPVPIGLYNIVVKMEGYRTETLTDVKAVQGKTNRVEVLLKKG